MGERFALGLETGAAKLAEQDLGGFAGIAVLQDVPLGDRRLCGFLSRPEWLDGFVGVRLIASQLAISRCSTVWRTTGVWWQGQMSASPNLHGSVTAQPTVPEAKELQT